MQEDPVTVEDTEAALRNPADRESRLVVVVEDVVRGWGRLWRYSDRTGYRFAAETAIFIDRAFRRRGLGTVLQAALIEESRRLGYHHLVAKIFAENSASIRMHESLGYEVVGIQREIGYKKGARKDVAILQFVHADQ